MNGLNQYTTITPASSPAATIVHDGPRARRRAHRKFARQARGGILVCRPSPTGGNITTDHRGHTYEYDAENVLRTIRDGGGATLANYVYYPDGNMRATSGERHYYDGDQEIAQYADAWPIGGGDEAIVRRFIRLPGSVDEPFLMIDYTLDATCDNDDTTNCERWG